MITADSEQKGNVTVSTINGTIAANLNIALHKGINVLDAEILNVLPSGIYFINVTIDNETYHLKLVK
jgi:hypothetical protein